MRYPSYQAAGIDIPWNKTHGEVKTYCPECHGTSKNKTHKNLSVNLDKGTWNCKNLPECGWRGGLEGDEYRRYNGPVVKSAATPPPIPVPDEDAARKGVDWLVQRGIDTDTITRNHLIPLDSEIGFMFLRGGVHINTQWRKIDPADVTNQDVKTFRMETGCDKDFWGVDDVVGETIAETWIITEGMMDKLAIETATGYENVVSVPNGVNSKLNDLLPPHTEHFKQVKRFILAGDMDEPGTMLMDELSRRLGKEKCRRVRWAGKDANDTLLTFGPAVVEACINEARPEPIEGVFHPADLIDDVIRLRDGGEKLGVPVMQNDLGKLLRVERGMQLLVSGIPGSGKSRGVDNIITDTGQKNGWRWAVCSPESWPLGLHQKHLIQIASGIPVAPIPSIGHPGMSDDEIAYWSRIVDEYVTYIKLDKMSLPGVIEHILKVILSQGVDAFVLDPWNRLGHRLPGGTSMTDYVGLALSELKTIEQHHNLFGVIAAHPAKPERAKDNGNGFVVVKPYDIADSHNFFDMADFILTFARHKDDDDQGTLVSVGKVKTEEYGREGEVTLTYDRLTGRLKNYQGVPS